MDQVSKYSLPRHTNLASMSARFGAAIVDLAIFIATAAILFFGCSNLIVTHAWTNAMSETMEKYDLESHLSYLDESGTKQFYESTDDYTVFDTQLRYYYLNYLTGVGIEEPEKYASPIYNDEVTLDDGSKALPKDVYTIYWYNTNVLEINPNDPFGESKVCYFKADVDEENKPDLYNKIGVIQSEEYDKDKNLSNVDRVTFMRLKYRLAYNHLVNLRFYKTIYDKYVFITTLSGMIPVLVSGIICYIAIPWFLKYQATLGKLIFKCGLANIHGYFLDKKKLLLRFVPFLLVWAVITFLTYNFLLISAIIFIAIFISSFAVMMASPKKAALHDWVAQSIVIDTKSSIIFNDSIEEETYVENEDRLEEQRILNKAHNG
ncbi:MAG: RDD family protein [Bacilli bacterium]|nr:RDD family protein [Bacilli bacterium]